MLQEVFECIQYVWICIVCYCICCMMTSIRISNHNYLYYFFVCIRNNHNNAPANDNDRYFYISMICRYQYTRYIYIYWYMSWNLASNFTFKSYSSFSTSCLLHVGIFMVGLISFGFVEYVDHGWKYVQVGTGGGHGDTTSSRREVSNARTATICLSTIPFHGLCLFHHI